jgi:hypothetical protein
MRLKFTFQPPGQANCSSDLLNLVFSYADTRRRVTFAFRAILWPYPVGLVAIHFVAMGLSVGR